MTNQTQEIKKVTLENLNTFAVELEEKHWNDGGEQVHIDCIDVNDWNHSCFGFERPFNKEELEYLKERFVMAMDDRWEDIITHINELWCDGVDEYDADTWGDGPSIPQCQIVNVDEMFVYFEEQHNYNN